MVSKGDKFVITQRFLDYYTDPKTGKILTSFSVGEGMIVTSRDDIRVQLRGEKYFVSLLKDKLDLLDRVADD